MAGADHSDSSIRRRTSVILSETYMLSLAKETRVVFFASSSHSVKQ